MVVAVTLDGEARHPELTADLADVGVASQFLIDLSTPHMSAHAAPLSHGVTVLRKWTLVRFCAGRAGPKYWKKLPKNRPKNCQKLSAAGSEVLNEQFGSLGR